MYYGLVIIPEPAYAHLRTVSLADATIHEYLSQNLEIVQSFDRILRKVCVKYPNFYEFVTHEHPFLNQAFSDLAFFSSHTLKDPMTEGIDNIHCTHLNHENPAVDDLDCEIVWIVFADPSTDNTKCGLWKHPSKVPLKTTWGRLEKAL